MVGGHLLAPVQDQGGRAAAAGRDARHAAFHAPFAAGLTILIEEDPQDRPYSLKGAGQPLEQDGLKQKGELAEIHVVFPGASVKHERAKQHVLQQRIGDMPPHDLAGRGRRHIRREYRSPDQVRQFAEPVGLGRKHPCHLAFEDGKIIGEPQRGPAAGPEGDAGLLLFAQAQFVAVDAKLAQ